MCKKIEMVGKRFGRLVVIKENGKTKKGELKYLCICDCGKEITRVGYCLRKGEATSCGCKKKEIIGNLLKTHGMTKTRIYRIWKHMLSRCINKNVPAYKDYGGRGILVCEQWKNNFLNFYNWAMNNNYTDDLTIDRIDVNGNYEPSNCRWADSITQNNNKRNNIIIIVNGESKTLQQISKETGITLNALRHRYHRNQDLFKPQTKHYK